MSATPAELAAIATRALDPRAEKRFESAEAFRAAVSAFLEHRSSAAMADEALARLEELRVQVARLRDAREGQVAQGGAEKRASGAEASGFEAVDADERDLAEETREVSRGFAECRFGFARALRDWPGNERARSGQLATLLLLAEYQLDRGDPASATETLETIDNLGDGDDAGVTPLRNRVAAELETQERLQRIGYDQDPVYGRRERARFVLVVALVLGALPIGGFVGQVMGWYRYEMWHSFAFTSGLAALLIFGAVAFRRQVMPNRAGRRFVTAMIVLSLLTLLNRVVAIALGHTEFRDVALDLFLFGSGGAMVGILNDRRFLALAVAFSVCGILTALIPSYGLLLIGIAAWAGPGWTAWAWLRSGANETPPRRSS